MIPIVAIANIISFILSSAIFFRVYRSYLDSRRSDALLRHFSSFFFFLAIFFLLSFPALIWDETQGDIAGYQILISYFLLAVATASFLRIPINFWLGYSVGRGVAWTIYIIAAFTFVAGVFLFEPAIWIVAGSDELQFGYFVFKQPFAVRLSSGGIPLLTALLGSIFFWIEGFRAFDLRVRARSLLMGLGMTLLLIAALSNFFIANVVFNFAAVLLASLLAVLGLIIMAIGIYLGSEKPRQE